MKKLLGLIGFSCFALVSTPASAADQEGAEGVLVSMQLNARGSDDFSAYHGAIEVRSWSKKKGKSSQRQYQWGGSNCPNRNLTSDQIEVLTSALSDNLRIKPAFVPGQLPKSRCLVSFKVSRPWGSDKGKKRD